MWFKVIIQLLQNNITDRDVPQETKKCPQTSLSFVLALFSSLFQLSWFEVMSGATVLSVTVTVLNYHVQTSTKHLDGPTVNLPHRSP